MTPDVMNITIRAELSLGYDNDEAPKIDHQLDFASDPDIMRALEMALIPLERKMFRMEFFALFQGQCRVSEATAAQLGEVFLRMRNRWPGDDAK